MSSKGWSGLRKEFKKLARRFPFTVEFYFGLENASWGVAVSGGRWEMTPLSHGVEEEGRLASQASMMAFQTLARAAAVASGSRDHPEAWVEWLEGLRHRELPEFEDYRWSDSASAGSHLATAGRKLIYSNIAETSAQYCRILAVGAPAPPATLAQKKPPADSEPRALCSWEDVRMEFRDLEKVRLKVKGRSLGTKTFADMGFSDGRKGRKDPSKRQPTRAWLVLVLLAQVGEIRLSGPARRSRPDDEAARVLAAHRRSENWVDQPSSASRVSHPARAFEAKKQIQSAREGLRQALRRFGFEIPAESDPLPLIDGSYRPILTLTYPKAPPG